MPSTEHSSGPVRRPLLRWQEIKNLLRLHSLALERYPSGGHWVITRDRKYAGNLSVSTGNVSGTSPVWKTAPDPQAYVIATIESLVRRRID